MATVPMLCARQGLNLLAFYGLVYMGLVRCARDFEAAKNISQHSPFRALATRNLHPSSQIADFCIEAVVDLHAS